MPEKTTTIICPVCNETREVIAHRAAKRQTDLCRSCSCKSRAAPVEGYPPKEHPLRHRWVGMKKRCNNPANKDYCRYGARGIRVCDEWSESFAAYVAWMRGHGWVEGSKLTVDRIDNLGPYTPENCRLVPVVVNNSNKRGAITLSFQGQSLTIPQWAEKTGLQQQTIRWRIRKGWPTHEVLVR